MEERIRYRMFRIGHKSRLYEANRGVRLNEALKRHLMRTNELHTYHSCDIIKYNGDGKGSCMSKGVMVKDCTTYAIMPTITSTFVNTEPDFKFEVREVKQNGRI